MPRTREEIDKRIDEVKVELKEVNKQLKEISDRIDNGVIGPFDGILNDLLFMKAKLLAQEFIELLNEAINKK